MCASRAAFGRGIRGHGGHFDCFHLRNDVFVTQRGSNLCNGKARFFKILVLFGKWAFFWKFIAASADRPALTTEIESHHIFIVFSKAFRNWISFGCDLPGPYPFGSLILLGPLSLWVPRPIWSLIPSGPLFFWVPYPFGFVIPLGPLSLRVRYPFGSVIPSDPLSLQTFAFFSLFHHQ